MATCGKCKQTDQTVAHVRECYAGTASVAVAEKPAVTGFAASYVESFAPKTPAVPYEKVPDSKYALRDDNGYVFYEVRTGKGKWADFQFMDRLIGHPGDWMKVPVKGANKAAVLNIIRQDPKEAALRYSREFVRCAACNSPLSDPESMERGFGPVCIERFM